MSQSRSSRPARPLDAQALESLALAYVGRFATTEARLADYLGRKIKSRGWVDDTAAPIEAIVVRFVNAGYIDDAEYAHGRARSLARRGYGHRRLVQALKAAGVANSIAETLAPDHDAAFSAADAFARRRRLGPYCDTDLSPADRRRHFAALVRAGHDFEFAKLFSSATQDDTIAD